jgi:L-aminopeptidase/D-esterase-like protein
MRGLRSTRFARWVAGLSIACAVTAAHAALPQDDLEILINDGFDAPGALKFEWPMISVGTGQYESGPTGVTVIRFGRKVLGAVDIRGGGPGTVNAAYLQLGYPTPEVDAVVFSGGSWYGLESVTAVNSALKDDGARGGTWDNIGLAVGSIIYDFGSRRLNEIYPDKRLAQAALRNAKSGVIPIGAYGAGRSAVTGSLFGCNAKSGQGAAFRQIGKLKIAVFTVVNALGVVTDREGRVSACHADPRWPTPLRASYLMRNVPDSLRAGWGGEKKNTTVSLVVTNQKLQPVELQRIATQVHTSMARAIQPFATIYDGDVLYAVSTGEVDAEPSAGDATVDIATVASDLMWDAVLASVPEQPAIRLTANRTRGSAAAIAALSGNYSFGEFAALRISARDRTLFAQASGQRPVFGIAGDTPSALRQLSARDFLLDGRQPLHLRFDGQRLILNPGRWQQVSGSATR